MNDAFRIAAAGIIAALCAMAVRKQVPELAGLLTLCAGVLILLYCSGALRVVTEFVDRLADTGGISYELIAPMMKITGIALITHLAASCCRDAKESALAAVVETAGAIFALMVSVPLMSAVLELLSGLL